MTIKTEKPLDYSGQVWRGIDDKFPKKIHNATTTSDGLMSAEDKAKLNSIDVNDKDRVYDTATWENDGLLSKEDKKKLDRLDELHINDHPASIISTDPNNRFVTDAQIEYWNSKASTSVATDTVNGLMSAEDKKRLDRLNELHANDHPASIITEDENHRFVTDEQIEYWNNKAEKDIATWYYDGLMSKEDKKKLDEIDEGANKYVHPNNEGIRHVSDAEKDYWNSKADKLVATNSEDGLMASKDKIKLDGIQENANNYIHPNDSNTRHVTDEQIKFWDSKVSTKVASQVSDGLMSKEDKKDLDRLKILYSEILTKIDSVTITDEEKDYWNNKVNFNDLATDTKDGLMSKEDKAKLDKVEELTSIKIENSKYTLLATEFAENQKVVISSIEGITEDTNITMGLDYSSITEEQYDAAASAKFITKIIDGNIEVTCFGKTPEIDIPVTISVIR